MHKNRTTLVVLTLSPPPSRPQLSLLRRPTRAAGGWDPGAAVPDRCRCWNASTSPTPRRSRSRR